MKSDLDKLIKEFTKARKEESVRSLTMFTKDEDDAEWMLAVYSNKFMDREGDILSEASHKAFAEFVEETGLRPALTVYHLPNMSGVLWKDIIQDKIEDIPALNEIIRKVYNDFGIGEVHRIIVSDGFAACAVKLREDKQEEIEIVKSMIDELGLSHKFLGIPAIYTARAEDGSITLQKVIDRYISVEMSLLPVSAAANGITYISAFSED